MPDEARCTVNVTIHPWCSDPARDAAVRAAEDGRTGPLPTLEEAIASPFADAAERSVPVSEMGKVQSGLRTERVTLECVHRFGKSPLEWDWWRLMELRPGESVRVVEEAHFDDLATSAMERDAAIRERDNERLARIGAETDRDFARHEKDAAIFRIATLRTERDALQALVAALEIKLEAAISERDKLQAELEAQINRDNASILDLSRQRTALTVRVSDLESQLESVACRAADAEMELEAASGGNRPETPEGSTQAASGGGVIRDMIDIILSDTDADEKHAALATLVEAVCPGWVMTKAASGGGEGEPVAYLIDGPFEKRAFRTRNEVYAYTRRLPEIEKQSMQLVSLYRSPPQPRGWLSEEERKAVLWAADAAYDKQHPDEDILRSLLARSTPPEVVLPALFSRSPGDRLLVEQQVRQALAAAGVAVKEASNED